MELAKNMTYLGIDLGTSNTVVAVYRPDQGEPKLIEIDHSKYIPSFAYFAEGDVLPVLGEAARTSFEEFGTSADSCFRRWKLQMGSNEVLTDAFTMTMGPTACMAVTPENLTTALIQYIVQKITDGLDGHPIERVVVTTPNGWRLRQPHKCAATRKAVQRVCLPGTNAPLPVAPVTLPEPVAAAVYAIRLYQTKSKLGMPPIWGEPIVVCDMGGGTFDVSQVQQDAQDQPINVGQAENTVLAGDFADALICSYALARFDAKNQTSYVKEILGSENATHFTQANQLMQFLSVHSAHSRMLRVWMGQVRRLKEKMSLWRRQKDSDDKVKMAAEETLRDEEGRTLTLSLKLRDLYEILTPLYENNRSQLTAFLNGCLRKPFGIVLCGGGSHILGVRDRIIRAALIDCYGVDEAEVMLSRIPINAGHTDQIIALGAALVAGAVVGIREHLMADVGVVMRYSPDASFRPKTLQDAEQEIGLCEDVLFLLSPILSRGAVLPIDFDSNQLPHMEVKLPSAGDFYLKLIVHDTPPHVEKWSFTVPDAVRQRVTDGSDTPVRWQIRIDGDGCLVGKLKAEPATEDIEFEGVVRRERMTQVENDAKEYLQGSYRTDIDASTDDDLSELILITPEQWAKLANVASHKRSWQQP